MGKFFKQVCLLMEKNLKIRLANRWLFICELVLPLMITLLVGLLTSLVTRDMNMKPGDFNSKDSSYSSDDSNDPDSKYRCHEDAHLYDYLYECEIRYSGFHGPQLLASVEEQARQVVYILPENSNTAETIMSTILRAGPASWTKSNMSESELESCVLHQNASCEHLMAVIIVTHAHDKLDTENKLEIEYKIRMCPSQNYMTDRLWADYTSGSHFTMEIARTVQLYLQQGWGITDLGIVHIQAFIDDGITQYVKDRKGKKHMGATAFWIAPTNLNVTLIRMPYIKPAGGLRNIDTFVHRYMTPFVTLIYSLLSTLSIFNIMRINTEKYTGFKELLRMHGVNTTTQWVGWLLSNFVVYSTWTMLLTLLLTIPLAGGPNLMTVLGINFILYWLVLLLFMMALTNFCFFVSVFFERVWTAASIGLVTWIMLTVVMIVTNAAIHAMRKESVLWLMLIPPVALGVAFRMFFGGGGKFTTVMQPVLENVPLTAFNCLFMLFLDSCLFFAVTVYLDNVLPSKHGARRSPWFVFEKLKKFWTYWNVGVESLQSDGDGGTEEASVEMTSIISPEQFSHPFQPDPEHVEPAVIIQNLRKQYKRGQKRVLDGLSLKIYTGEIFALLGFNGAGKTTTIGILSGLTSPTDGYCQIFDLDVEKDMEKIRQYIGLCPQHNLLFNDLTVWQQVAFFGQLKGIMNPGQKARELLDKLGLKAKSRSRPYELSAGQKRRVHLAIALIGDTKLAFLDEPTSGLDPESRREVWDLLMKLRGEVTLVLTTHDMGEADFLGDRIGIMSEGKMMCCGTPSFLKRHYGVGYNLRMSATAKDCDIDVVYDLVREHVPNAKLLGFMQSREQANVSGSPVEECISISLPMADLKMEKLGDLMASLRDQKADLGVDSIGLSLSTMNEVFLKVSEALNVVNNKRNDDPHPPVNIDSRYSGNRLFWYRFETLLLKKYYYFLHAPWTILILFLIFSFIFFLCLTMLSIVINTPNEPDPPHVISAASLAHYRNPNIFLHENISTQYQSPLSYTLSYLHQLHSLFEPPRIHEFPRTSTQADILNYLKQASLQDLHNYRYHNLLGASFNFSQISGYFSAYALHSAPLTFNLLSQAIIKRDFAVDAEISVVNHPFKHIDQYIYITDPLYQEAVNENPGSYVVKSGGVLIVVVISSLLLATTALLPTEERLNKGKQLQLMTGTTPWLYWSATFAWDFLFFTVINLNLTLTYGFADVANGNFVYTNHGAGLIIFLILECHTFAMLWFCYLLSIMPFVHSATDAFMIANKTAVIIGCFWSVLRHTFMVFFKDGTLVAKICYYVAHLTGYVLYVVPSHSLYLSMLKLISVSIPNSMCYWIPKDILEMTCAAPEVPRNSTTWYVYRCCANCTGLGHRGLGCFESKSYWNASSMILYDDHETHSMMFDIMGLIFSGVVSATALFALEYSWFWDWEMERDMSQGSQPGLDGDVKDEAARVDDICGQDNALETANHALICHRVAIQFKETLILKGLSFGVYPGECFGLLGQNGAGKTTAFRVITADLDHQGGEVYAWGLNLSKKRREYLKGLGYCPQFDGLIESLSGLRMVTLYGRLRGIPEGRVDEVAKYWLDKFGLLGDANRKCGEYSGGMKRRLSAAMAMIGNPRLLLLDEPTAGVDPAFRKQFWEVIEARREKGQSVLLTSHSMDECESLCNRLGIMVNGQLRCLGNIQHLKAKYGKGYILTLKYKRMGQQDGANNTSRGAAIEERVTAAFQPCEIQSLIKNVMAQYQILNKSLWYSDIIRIMEEIRQDPEAQAVLEEYSVTETCLEDVFISFVNKARAKTQEE